MKRFALIEMTQSEQQKRLVKDMLQLFGSAKLRNHASVIYRAVTGIYIPTSNSHLVREIKRMNPLLVRMYHQLQQPREKMRFTKMLSLPMDQVCGILLSPCPPQHDQESIQENNYYRSQLLRNVFIPNGDPEVIGNFFKRVIIGTRRSQRRL
jgi:hypothetical protein